MNRRTILAALTLGASIAASCVVYGPDDLNGAGQSGAGLGGSTSGGRGGGGTGVQGGQGGDSMSGGSPNATAGNATGGTGNAPGGGRGGEAFGGEGGDLGGAPPMGGVGGGATSGTGGGGGTVVTPVDKTIIDELEDGNHQIKRVQDPPGVYRTGFWFTYATGTYAELLPVPGEMFVPEPHPDGLPGPEALGPDPQNTAAFRLYARQVAEGAGYGAGCGFTLIDIDPPAVYDASRYVGVSFWVRASKSLTFRLQLATKGTDATSGVCTPAAKCSDHYFVELSAGTAWTKIESFWDGSDFAQEGWGTKVPFVSAELMSIQFFVPAAATRPDMEFWLDNIAFIAPAREEHDRQGESGSTETCCGVARNALDEHVPWVESVMAR